MHNRGVAPFARLLFVAAAFAAACSGGSPGGGSGSAGGGRSGSSGTAGTGGTASPDGGTGGVSTTAGTGGTAGVSPTAGTGGTGAPTAGTGGGGGAAPSGGGGAVAGGGAGGTAAAGSGGGGSSTTGTGGAAVMSAGCGAPSWPTSKSYTISVTYNNQTKSRSYILRIPDNYDPIHPYRLVIAYHWLGGTMENVANGGGATSKPFYGLWELANGSTIFVAPQGIDPANGWADTGGPGDPHDGPTNKASTGGQDIAFTKALVADLKSKLCIDTTRIMAEGFSMGGSMSYAVACAMPEVFRAVAVHSGGPMSGCVTHNKPVAYFMTHGEQDGTCTYPGYGVPELKDFSTVDGCAFPNQGTSTGLPAPTGAQGTHQCVDFQGCMVGYPVRSCIFVGPHTPSSPDTGSSNWIPGESWKFLSQF